MYPSLRQTPADPKGDRFDDIESVKAQLEKATRENSELVKKIDEAVRRAEARPGGLFTSRVDTQSHVGEDTHPGDVGSCTEDDEADIDGVFRRF